MKRRASVSGFTLIEMLVALSIMMLLVRLTMPAMAGVRRGAIASEAAGDFNTVRAAAVAQYEATGSYATDAPDGLVPAGMGPYLPRDFSFTRPAYQLDWDNYSVADTTSGSVTTGQVLALTVTASDSLVGLQILNTLGANCTHWSVGSANTFVVMSTLESPH